MSYYTAGVVTVSPPNYTNSYNHNINYNLNQVYYNPYNSYGWPQYGNEPVLTGVEKQQDPYNNNYNYDPYHGNGNGNGNGTTAYYQPYGQPVSNLADIYNSEEYVYNNDTLSNVNTNTNTNHGPNQEYDGQQQNITYLQNNNYYNSYGPSPNLYNNSQINSGGQGQNKVNLNTQHNMQKNRPFKKPPQPLVQRRTIADSFVQMLVFPFSIFAFSMMFMDIISRLMPLSLPAMPSLLKYAMDLDILPKSKSKPMKEMEMKTTSRPPKLTKLNIQGPMIPTLVDLIGIEPVINQLHKLKQTKKNIKNAKKKGKKRRKKYEYDSSEEWDYYEYDDVKGRRRIHPKRSRIKYKNYKKREKIKYSDSPAETLKNIQKFYTSNYKKQKKPSIYY